MATSRASTYVVAWLVAGCGRVAFEPRSDASSDARSDAGPVGLTACEEQWLAGPVLSPPDRILALATTFLDQTPHLSSDGLTLYFASDRNGGNDVYSAKRPTTDAAFGAPTLVMEAMSAFSEVQLSVSPNGLEAILATTRPGGIGDFDHWRATRATTSGPFGAFTLVPELSSIGADYNAVFSTDGLRVFFASLNRPGNVGLTDIWSASRPALDQPFGTAELYAPFPNTTDHEASPTLTASERIILFAREINLELHIYYATRPDVTSAFGPAMLVPGVNDLSSLDNTPFIRPDGCELFFNSYRAGSGDIHVSRIQL